VDPTADAVDTAASERVALYVSAMLLRVRVAFADNGWIDPTFESVLSGVGDAYAKRREESEKTGAGSTTGSGIEVDVGGIAEDSENAVAVRECDELLSSRVGRWYG